MEWRDEGFVLAARPHGEGAAVVQLLTREHGRHAGLVHGGASRAKRATVEPGNLVDAVWRARLAEHLGRFTIEPARHYAAQFMDDPPRLAALSAACAVTEAVIPEREPHPGLFEATGALFDSLAQGEGDIWPAVYIQWEMGLLRELGFGLDLTCCAATGDVENLLYVSPRTGRAVSRDAGESYKDRMFALPRFLRPDGRGTGADAVDFADGLRLTGFFLQRHAFDPLDRPLPPARERLETLVERQSDNPENSQPDS
ncbi:MAG: DNA repair protein RecO [Alphaproteobacteria bacterium]|mgnify:CR=1 FL=1|nr:DNA repair protein RecO [Alphaproteobacteria bacterium]|tara:strand:+ start:1634 stop:2401 length:768 start_codon:yes stop_codon:yes gene_type:complete